MIRPGDRTTPVRWPAWAAAFCVLSVAAVGWHVAGPALAGSFDSSCRWGDLSCMERAAKNLQARGDAEIARIAPESPDMEPEAAADRAQQEKRSIESAIDLWLKARNAGVDSREREDGKRDDAGQDRESGDRSSNAGVGSGVQAAVTAQRRIKMYSLTCVIADKTDKVMGDPLADVRIQQQALDALGYYQGPRDGQLSVATRIAIRRFQNAMAWIDSGELTSRQIVYLICNGAETARDARSATRLALMYAAGIGVMQHHGYALGFLRQAEPRDLDAKYYLAVLSGTGRCGFPQNFDRADERLKEASDQKHLVAQFLQSHHPPMADQAARWRSIEADIEYRKSTSILDKDCPLPPLPARALRPPAPAAAPAPSPSPPVPAEKP